MSKAQSGPIEVFSASVLLMCSMLLVSTAPMSVQRGPSASACPSAEDCLMNLVESLQQFLWNHQRQIRRVASDSESTLCITTTLTPQVLQRVSGRHSARQRRKLII